MASAVLPLALLALLAASGAARAQLLKPPRCAATPDGAEPRCIAGEYGQNEYPYTVDGLNVLIEFTDSGFFSLKCPKNSSLDYMALPRFEIKLRVTKVLLKYCPPPPKSYAAVFDALNLFVLDKLKLVGPGNVTRRLLAGLELSALELVGAALEANALGALPVLRRLAMDDVRLPPGELQRLPPSLEALDLTRMGEPLPAAALLRLPALVNVTVRDSQSVAVEPAGALRELALEMPEARVAPALLPTLRRLTVYGWDEPAPRPWRACGALRSLETRDATARALPPGWLQDCAELRVLDLRDAAALATLAASALHAATRLQELRITGSSLAALPEGLLDRARDLSVLDLSGNKLLQLPSGLFVGTKSLQSLYLSRNRLDTSVFYALTAVTSLTTLDLSKNVHLGDSCGGESDTLRGSSPLQYLNKLIKLNLSNTGASMICWDWRENMPMLQQLDLSRNNITVVTYTDLMFRGAVDVSVNLSRNNVTRLLYTRHDHARAAADAPSRAAVRLDAALACDCELYWAARALRDSPRHVALRGAACAGARPAPLRAVPPADLLCAAPALCAGAPRACRCARADRGGARPALRVTCERAAVRRAGAVVRAVRAAARAAGEAPDAYTWELRLAHNAIDRIEADELPLHFSELDLSYNQVTELDEATARALAAGGGRLAHNPLACLCAHRAALGALPPANLTCAGGGALAPALAAACAGPRPGPVAAGAALLTLLAAAAAAGALWHPALRARLKAALHRRGWLAADEAAARWDVFVSHSHADERFVRALVARLEAGAAPLRVCVHWRDWAPGGWIPAQIAASVRASRRTLAVVSEHFLRSAWARAEFREAHALALRSARPRLVVLLLDAPERLPLDAKLRSFLAANTYVRWGDPWFWDKLSLALPPAAPAPPAPPAPPPDLLPPPAPPAGAAKELDLLMNRASGAGDVAPLPA